MRVLLFFVAFHLISHDLLAQQRCGTTETTIKSFDEKLLDQYKRKLLEKSMDIDSIAITFHIINEAISAQTIEKEISFLNKYFSRANIVFFTCGSARQIDGTDSYNFNQGDELNARNHAINTINVYYVPSVIDFDGEDLCGYAYFPGIENSERYVVVSSESLCLIGGSTLAHELGHFYGLPHTHSTALGEELADGSNCMTAGDGLCDTPADPNLGIPGAINISSCQYTGSKRDAAGNTYMPSVSNIMSYAHPRCMNKFSLDQLALVRLVHENENSFVFDQCNFYPDFEVVAENTIPNVRFDENVSIEYEFENTGIQEEFDVPVFIYLSENSNELGTVIKKDTIKFSPFGGNKFESYDIDLPLGGSKKYYLTISVDPNSSFIEVQKNNNLFTTQVIVDNSQLEDNLVFPNPTDGIFKVFIRDAKINGDLTISIYDLDGRLQRRTYGSKQEQEYFSEIDISSFREGLYLVEIYFEKFEDRKIFRVYKSE